MKVIQAHPIICCFFLTMLYHQTGTLFMSNRILWKKLNLLHHVATLPEGTLARDFHDVQVKYKLQNTLVSECQDTLRQFGITNIQSYTKYSFKKITKAKIIAKNSEELIQMASKYKKIDIDSFSSEPFEVQPYFKQLNVPDSRFKFKLKSRVTAKIANNCHNDKRFKAIGYRCIGCLRDQPIRENHEISLDTEEHILNCNSYSHLRLNKQMDRDTHIIEYFRQVIALREEDWG